MRKLGGGWRDERGARWGRLDGRLVVRKEISLFLGGGAVIGSALQQGAPIVQSSVSVR